MIVKKVKFGKSTKPKAKHIGNLVDYIRHPHNVNVEEKIAHSGSRNFLTDTHHGQRAEMIALAQESTRSNMPVSHWIFSWEEHEQPTHEQVDELVDIFLQRMGLEEHQTVYGLHHNTRNYHVHIAVNRTHPETLKVIAPHKGFDIEEAHKILAVVEHKQGWKSNANARYALLENGELVKKYMLKAKPKPSPKAVNFEQATGEKSAMRIAQERGHDIIAKAKTWAELHEELAGVGLRFEKKGSGAIVFVPSAGEDMAVKASSINRAFSMTKLCKRLGAFEAGNYEEILKTAQVEATPEPVSTIHLETWQQYQDYLSTQKKRPSFSAWLRKQGLHKQAEIWRYRHAFEKKLRPVPTTQAQMANDTTEAKAFERYAHALQADRFRVTCINMKPNAKQKVFILDKEDGITKGFSAKELLQKMPEMRRLQMRRENIYYTPLSAQRHHILIDDMTAESVGKFKKDGFTPAIILESSPNNYQCILTINKMDSPFDREASNRLVEQLNKEYGDPKLSGCIHPHRAPGFGNFKPKYENADGSFPRVKLLFAERQPCDYQNKAYLMLRQIAKQYEEQAQRPATTIAKPTHPLPDSSMAYYKHYEDMIKHMRIEDYSRMDAMIAMRMRVTGHSREAVQAAITDCAPTIEPERRRKEGRNWQRYAERTVNFAFGVAGDVALMRYERIFDYWRKVEREVQKEQSRMRL